MTHFEKLEVYQLSVCLSGRAWSVVREWDGWVQRSHGSQLVRAADSVGANIAEGSGRGSRADYRRCLYIARGSLYETKHWLRLANQRGLLSEEDIHDFAALLNELLPKLNALISALHRADETGHAKEAAAPYLSVADFGTFNEPNSPI